MVTRLLAKLFGSDDTPTTKETTTTTTTSAATTDAESTGEARLVEFVEFVVKSLVVKDKEVKVTSEVDEQGLLIRIYCHPDEVGRVIGKSGKTIRAIRSLVKGAAARERQKASVIVMED